MADKYILLVEDNPDEVVLTKLAFDISKISIRLVVARDGQEALDFLFGRDGYSVREQSEQPSLILLDLNLPLVSGFEVLRLVRTENNISEIPVVVLTSSNEERDRFESIRLGANEYIRKPIGLYEFAKVVSELVPRWVDSDDSKPQK